VTAVTSCKSNSRAASSLQVNLYLIGDKHVHEKTNSRKITAFLLTVLCSSFVYAVDFLEAAPKQTKVLLENEKVRVIEVQFKKGDKVPMHSHPEIVLYAIKSGKTRFTDADGKTTESKSPDGTATFRPPTTHSHEHLEDAHAIVIELKK
jgi:quercetin dioxygenase-like cupin family protein